MTLLTKSSWVPSITGEPGGGWLIGCYQHQSETTINISRKRKTRDLWYRKQLKPKTNIRIPTPFFIWFGAGIGHFRPQKIVCHCFTKLSIFYPLTLYLSLSLSIFHSLYFTLPFYLSLSLSIFNSHSLSFTLSVFPSHTLPFTLTLYLSLSLSNSHSLQYLSLSIFHYHFLPFTLTLYLSLWLSTFHSHSLSFTLYISLSLSTFHSHPLSFTSYPSLCRSEDAIGSMQNGTF